MNKTMEYMAFRLPVVAFDLRETRVSARDAARYVAPGDVEGYAAAIVDLVDDPQACEEMGRSGAQRVEEHLAWEHQRVGYLAVFDELAGRSAARGHEGEPEAAAPSTPSPDLAGSEA